MKYCDHITSIKSIIVNDRSTVLGDKRHTGLDASRTCHLERPQPLPWVRCPRRAAGSRRGGQSGEILSQSSRDTLASFGSRERNDYSAFQVQAFHFPKRKDFFFGIGAMNKPSILVAFAYSKYPYCLGWSRASLGIITGPPDSLPPVPVVGVCVQSLSQ